jgi:hypothetical protein
MRCQGQGDVFLAELPHDVHLLNLTNSGLSISGKNVLAFSLSLTGTSSGQRAAELPRAGCSIRRCAAAGGSR